MKQRKARNAVRLSAQMRSDRGCSDVSIRNISTNGMLLSADETPEPRSYLEVRRDNLNVVARIVWRRGTLFGVRTQDAIDLTALTAARPPRAGRETPGLDLAARRAPPGETADRSRLVARAIQFTLLLIAITAAAAALTTVLRDALAPLHAVETYLLSH